MNDWLRDQLCSDAIAEAQHIGVVKGASLIIMIVILGAAFDKLYTWCVNRKQKEEKQK